MIIKEKAAYMVSQFTINIIDGELPKECALRCCDEIISTLKDLLWHNTGSECDKTQTLIARWSEIKTEIEKL